MAFKNKHQFINKKVFNKQPDDGRRAMQLANTQAANIKGEQKRAPQSSGEQAIKVQAKEPAKSTK